MSMIVAGGPADQRRIPCQQLPPRPPDDLAGIANALAARLLSARSGASGSQGASAFGEKPNTAWRPDRDLSSWKAARVAVTDGRVPGQQAVDHARLKRQLHHEAVVGRPVITHVVSQVRKMRHYSRASRTSS
jgi:hypothetical protein